MESALKSILIEQIKEKHISVRELHAQIEKICVNDHSAQWISLSTLERRIQHPDKISSEELNLIRDAVRATISESAWIHIKRNITEKLRYRYATQIDQAVSRGFALHQKLADYDNTLDSDDFIEYIRQFYRSAPSGVRKRWLELLPTYLLLPDLAKAGLLCGSYIGKNIAKSEEYDCKILKFIDYFPVFQGVNILGSLEDHQISVLSGILQLAATAVVPEDTPDIYCRYSIDKNLIEKPTGFYTPAEGEDTFLKMVVKYKRSITDFLVTPETFIRGICFALYISRAEWLLAYTTSIIYYNMDDTEKRLFKHREYHDRGCTGFRFTDKELDYLCSLLYSLEN